MAKVATGPKVEPRGQFTYVYVKVELRRAYKLRVAAWWVKARLARYEVFGLGPEPDALASG